MSFYAVFYAARGILAYLREAPKTHKGARARFHLRAVQESGFPPQVAVLWDELKEDREQADYDIWTMDSWDDQAAVEAIAKAGRFVGEAAARLERHRTVGQ